MVAGEALAVLGAYVVMVAMNALANKNVFASKANKQISDEHPTYLSPDGKTFAVWGLIYLFEIVTTIVQLIPSERTDEILGRTCVLTGLTVRWRLVLAFLSNALWLPVFNNENFRLGLVIMIAYLSFLVSIYVDVNVYSTSGIFEHLAFATGVALNTSWIVVAFFVNLLFCLGEAGWKDEHGVAGSVSVAVVVVNFVAALGCERALRECDLAWAFVAAWALRGIYRMQTVPDKVRFPLSAMSSNLGSCAQWASWTVLLVMVAGVGLAVVEEKHKQ